MAKFEVGGSEGYENGQLIHGDYYCSLDPSNSMDQGSGQNPQQQFGQDAGTNGFLPDSLTSSTTDEISQDVAGAMPWLQEQLVQPADAIHSLLPDRLMNQVQSSQAAAPTDRQYPAKCTADPHSRGNIGGISKEEARRARKRVYNRLYRQRIKGKNKLIKEERQMMKSNKKVFEAGNGRLKREIDEKQQPTKPNMEEFENGRLKRGVQENEQLVNSNTEARNGVLKHEIQAKTQVMKSNMGTLEAEIKRLSGEFESLRRNNVSVNQRVQTHSRELAELRNKLEELKQQNHRTEKKRRICSTRELKAAQIQSERGVEQVSPTMPCMMENFNGALDEDNRMVSCGVGDVLTRLPAMNVFLLFFFIVLVMSCTGDNSF